MRTQRIAAAIALTAICGLISCTDGPSPVSPGNSGIARLALAPSYSISGYFQTLPINVIRLTAFIAGTTTPLPPTPTEFPVEPDDESWSLPVEFELPSEQQVQVEVLIELVNRTPSGEETVEFSGRTAPLQVTSGNNQNVASVTVHPGPPANLNVNIVAITTVVDDAVEGDVVELDATVDGPAGAVVTWGTLDPGLVQIAVDGARSANVTTLLPGAARIIAVAGPRSDTVTLQILQRPTAVTIEPGDVTLNALDADTAFAAQLLDPRGDPIANAEIAWDVIEDGVVEIDDDGNVTSVGNGTARVVATASGKADTATVTVAQRAADINLSLTSLTLRALGAEATIEAEAEDAEGNSIAGSEFDWSSSDTDVVTVDSEGTVEAVGNGNATVTAELDGETAQVVVTVQQVATDVIVSPAEVLLTAIGESAQLEASVEDSLGSAIEDADVDWSSFDEDAVDVSPSGLVTAVAGGVSAVRATADDAFGEASVRVEQAAASITLDPAAGSFDAIGQTLQLTASALDAGGAEIQNPSITWTSSDNGVVTVSDEGVVTAAGDGTATVTAASGGEEGTATFTVQQAPAALAISYELGAGDTQDHLTADAIGAAHQFSATVADANGHALPAAAVQWSSTNASVADVGSSGLVTINGNGSAYILAVSGDVRDSVLVSVQQVAATIEVEPTAVTFESVGETQPLTAIVRDANATIMTAAVVEWSSSAADVVSVTSSGLLTALAQGSAIITATSGDANTTVFANVEQVVGAVVVEPANATLAALDKELSLTATVFDQAGGVMDLTVTWHAIEDGIVDVDGNGTVTSVGNGTAHVVATAAGKADTATITVQQVATTIDVVPLGVEFEAVGDTRQLTATVGDANGVTIAGAPVTWTSSDPDVVTVSTTGLLTAIAQGHSVITATSGAASVTLPANVDQEVASVEVAPPQATLTALGRQLQLQAVVLDANGEEMDFTVTWTKIGEGVVDLDDEGLVIAVNSGTARIVATAGPHADTATINVVQNVAAVEIVRDTLDDAWVGDTITVDQLGETAQAVALVFDSTGHVIPGAVVEWSSSNPEAVHITTSGAVTVVGNGSTIIYAESGPARDSVFVIVEQQPAEITLSPHELSFTSLGDTARIVAEVRDGGDHLIHDAPVTWVSSSPEVASVDTSGLVRANGNGQAWIRASSGEAIDSAFVNVSAGVASIEMPRWHLFTRLSQTLQPSVIVRDANGSVVEDAEIVFSSSDSTVATVSADGLVTPVASGRSHIIAQADALIDTLTVYVFPVETAAEMLTFSALGQTVTLPAGLGVYIETAGTFHWSSQDPEIVFVSENVATAVSNGQTFLDFTFEFVDGAEFEDSVAAVVQQEPALITLSQHELSFTSLGDTAQIVAEVRDAGENLIHDAVVDWTTSNPEVAAVDSTGLVSANGNGTAWIRAFSGAAADSVFVSVNLSAASIDIHQDSATYSHIGEEAAYFATVRDGLGNVVEDSIFWVSQDTSVIVINQGGFAISRGNGSTWIFAFSGPARDSSLVRVEQVTSFIELDVTEVTLNALGRQQAVNVLQFLDAGNHPVFGDSAVWFTEDSLVARVVGAGPAAAIITAVGNGSTRIRGAAGFSQDNWVNVLVEQQPAFIQMPSIVVFSHLPDSMAVEAFVQDGSGNTMAGAEVSWSSSDESVATVSAQGVVRPVNVGFAQVTASSGTAEAVLDVGVFNPGELFFHSLTQPKQLSTELTDAEGDTAATFAWSSADTSIIRVDDSEVATAVANGQTQLTVQMEFADSTTFDFTFFAQVAQQIAFLNIGEDSVPFTAVGADHQLTVAVRDSMNQEVQSEYQLGWWSFSDGIASVDSTGRVTATGAGETYVFAAAGEAMDSVKIIVKLVADSIAISPPTHEFAAANDTLTAVATVYDANDNVIPGAEVVWATSDSSVVIAHHGGFLVATGAGQATVTVTSGEVSATMAILVVQTASHIEITNPDSTNTFESLTETVQLAATVLDTQGDAMDVSVIWSSSDTEVATVTANGLVTSVGNGDVTITAVMEDETNSTNVITSTEDSPPGPSAAGASAAYMPPDPLSESIALTVHQIPVAVEIAEDSVQLNALFRTHDFVVGSVRDALEQELERSFFVNWRSENETKVAIGPPCDTCSQGRARALGNGKTRVIAEIEGVEDSALVHVKQVPGHLRITTRGVNIHALTHSRHFQAEVLDPDSFALETQPDLLWLSDDTTKAKVNSAGQVTARGNGAARIKARLSQDGVELEDTATVSIRQVPAKLRLNSGHKNVRFNAFGRSKQLSAVIQDSADVELETQPGKSWRSADTTKVQVDENGNTSNKPKNGNARVFVEFDTGDGVIADTAEVVTGQVAKQLRIKSQSRGPRFRTLGRKVKLEAEVEDSAGFAFETPPALQWLSSDEEDAEFAADTLIARGNGNPVVTARFQSGDLLLEDTTLVDIQQFGAKIKVKPESRGVSLRALTAQRRLEAEVQDSLDNPLEAQPELNWSSASDTVDVDSEGDVIARRNGRSKITVSYSAFSDTVTVDVKQVGKRITFPDQLRPGTLNRKYRLNAVVKDSLDNVLEVPVDLDWSEDGAADDVLEVSGDTVVFSRGNGNGKLILQVDEAEDTLDVPVRQVVTRLRMNRDTATLTAYDAEVQLTPIAEDSLFQPVDDAEFTWTSSDTTAASVDVTGKVKAKKNASVTATAHLDDSEIPTDLEDPTYSTTVTVSQRPSAFVADTSEVVNKQHGRSNNPLADSLKVVVTDANGFPLEHGVIRWRPNSQHGSASPSTDSLTAAKGGKSRSRWTLPSADQDSVVLRAWAVVGGDSISYEFAAVVDDEGPDAVTFSNPPTQGFEFALSDTVTITGIAHDDRKVDHIRCEIQNSEDTTLKTIHVSWPKSEQEADQPFACAFTDTSPESGSPLPAHVPLWAVVYVYDRAGNEGSLSIPFQLGSTGF